VTDAENQPYIQKDLIDYSTFPTSKDTYIGQRPDWVEAALPDEAVIQYVRSGGYQGQYAFVIRLDGYIWLFNDYHGSCGGCDDFIDRQWQWTEDMLRRAYCFESEEDAVEYLSETDDFSWFDINLQTVLQMVKSPQKNRVDGESGGNE